jgi:hypothetical protein
MWKFRQFESPKAAADPSSVAAAISLRMTVPGGAGSVYEALRSGWQCAGVKGVGPEPARGWLVGKLPMTFVSTYRGRKKHSSHLALEPFSKIVLRKTAVAPQGLKPRILDAFFGPAKAVPLLQS